MFPSLEALAVCGVETPGLVELGSGYKLAEATAEAWLRLQAKARDVGFALQIESAHRPFDRQLSIWNRKARGELRLLDPQGRDLDALSLSPTERMWAILHWSALPGTSRHHWGSDLDISDANAIPPGYEVELTSEEVAPNGIFGPLHAWLDEQIATSQAADFFRPFRPGCGSIQPERWHLSHAPSARKAQQLFSPQILRTLLREQQIELLHPILEHLDEILDHTVYPYFLTGSVPL